MYGLVAVITIGLILYVLFKNYRKLELESHSNIEVIANLKNDLYDKDIIIATYDEKLRSLHKLEDSLDEKDEKIRDLQLVISQLRQENAVLASQYEEREKHLNDKLEFLNHVQVELGNHFSKISQGVLEKNNRIFLELATENLSKFQMQSKAELEHRQKAIHDSMKNLGDVVLKLNETNKQMEEKRASAYSGLFEQIKTLSSTQNRLQTETRNLVTALRAPQQRGRWGELQLRRVVELAGLIEHCDFEEQVTSQDPSSKLRPDLVVRLPNNRNIVVDSKVALDAYLHAIESENEQDKASKLRAHAAQVKRHMMQLSAKAYWQQFSPAPEFVVMFLPGEPMFTAALEQDPTLIEIGAEHKVLIATPMTLIALLRAVAYGWRQEKMAENVHKVSVMASELHQRFFTMVDHFTKIGVNLDRSVKSYNDTVGSMERMVLPQIRKLKEQGLSSGDTIPEVNPVEKITREMSVHEHKDVKTSKKSLDPVLKS